MPQNIDPTVVATILATVARNADGATLKDIISGFAQPPPRRTAQYWVRLLIDAGALRVVTSSEPYRYFANAPGGAGGPVGNAVANAPVNGLAVANAQANGLAVANAAGDAGHVGHAIANPTVANPPIANVPVSLPTPGALPTPPGTPPAPGPGHGQVIANPSEPGGKVGNAVTNSGVANAPGAGGPVGNAIANASAAGTPVANVPAAGTPIANPAIANVAVANPAIANARVSLPTPGALPTPPGTPPAPALGHGQVIANPPGPSGQVGKAVTNSGIANAPQPSRPVGNVIANSPTDMPVANVPVAGSGVANPPIANPPGAAGHVGNAVANSVIANAPVSLPTPPASPVDAAGKATPSSASAPASKPAHRRPAKPDQGPAPDPNAAWERSVEGALGASLPPQIKPFLGRIVTWLEQHIPGGTNPFFKAGLGLLVVLAALGLTPLAFDHYGIAIAVLVVLLVGYAAYTYVTRTPSPRVAPAAGSPDVSPGNPSDPVPASAPGSRRRRLLVVAATAALILVIVSLAWWWQGRSRPGESDVSAWVLNSAAPLPVRITGFSATYLSPAGSLGHVTYTAVLELTAPLYQRVDAAQTDIPGLPGSRLSAAELANPKLSNLQLVTVASPPGTTATTSGTLLAWRADGRWQFKIENGQWVRPQFRGEPKPTGPAVFVIDDPADVARLKTLLDAQAAAAAKAQADRQAAVDALAHMIQRGAWIVGTLTADKGRDPHAVLFEVTASSPATHQISLDLRNDRGIWTNTRTFTGDWRLSAEGDSCTLNLRSSGGNGNRNAGPVLDNESTLYLTLQLWPDGTITATPRTWQLHAVAAADIAATKSQFGYDAAAAPSLSVTGDSLSGGTGNSAAAAPAPGSTWTAPPPSTGQSTSAPAPADVGPRLRVPPTVPPEPANSEAPASDVNTAPPSALSPPPSAVRPPSSALRSPPSALSPPAPSAVRLPPSTFPSGAYVLIGDRWTALPHNNGRLVQTAEQAERLLQLMTDAPSAAAPPSSASDSAPTPVGQLAFNTYEDLTTSAGANLTLAYIGSDASAPAKSTPPSIELARLKTGRNDVRTCALYFVRGNGLGFGPNRLPATIETPSDTITILHATAPLTPGHYAVFCGTLANTYELIVK